MICRNCDHLRDLHPHLFLCFEDDCHCPGWVAKAAGTL